MPLMMRLSAATCLAAASLLPLPAVADEAAAAAAMVAKAERTFKDFVADPDMKWFRKHVGKAHGLLILPSYGKAGFIIGGAGGTGLLLARDPSTGKWSQPAFYGMGAASIGLQIGVEAAEIILLVNTPQGLDAFLSSKAQLGANASVAAGPVGVGAEAAMVDILAFSRAKGAFAGLTVEGAVITPRAKRNAAYYGRPTSATDILIRRNVTNPNSASLLATVSNELGG